VWWYLSLRNLLRNRRRTLLCMTVIALGAGPGARLSADEYPLLLINGLWVPPATSA
jgi:hypothetical protein